MFQRVQFEEWQTAVTIAVFIVFSLAFLFFCWRALRMSRAERQRLSELPLANEQKHLPSHEPSARAKRR